MALYLVDPLPALKPHHPRGHQHVRAALQQFLTLKLPIRVEVRQCIEAGARRGSDGWRIAIDNPFGTA